MMMRMMLTMVVMILMRPRPEGTMDDDADDAGEDPDAPKARRHKG